MLCGFSSLWWPFGWNWSYLGFLGIIWRTCGSKCRGEGGGIFPTLCVECCLVVILDFKRKTLFFQRNYRQINSRFPCSAAENYSHISPHKYSPCLQASSGGLVVAFCPLVPILPRYSYHGRDVHARDAIRLRGPAREALLVTRNDIDYLIISVARVVQGDCQLTWYKDESGTFSGSSLRPLNTLFYSTFCGESMFVENIAEKKTDEWIFMEFSWLVGHFTRNHLEHIKDVHLTF